MNLHGIDIATEPLERFCRKWKIRELEAFGSVLRDDFRPDSDIDLLVSFAEDAEWSLWDHIVMQDEMAKLVGRRVDMIERHSVEQSENWIRRKHILSHVRSIYRAA